MMPRVLINLLQVIWIQDVLRRERARFVLEATL